MLALATMGWIGWNFTLDALWQPTDRRTISQILKMLDVSPGDTVYDLGCGDGRWLSQAVKERDVRAVGVEIDPVRVIISWMRLVFSGSITQAKVIWGNMYGVDLSDADAVILFLSEEANAKLSSKLGEELSPGTRIASFYHELPNWTPVLTEKNKDDYDIYIYERRDGR